MKTDNTSTGSTRQEYLLESSVNDARWLFGFVAISGIAVFAAGIVASIFAA